MLAHRRFLSAAFVALATLAASSALAQPSLEQLTRELGGGVWENTTFISIERFETVPIALTPEYQAKRDEQIANRAAGRQVFTAEARCIPSGMPRQMIAGGFEVFVRPGSIGLMTTGRGLEVRNIWLDGRKPTPEDELFDSFSGESIGRWEGDVLVVDTHGLRPTNEFLYGVQGKKMTIRERFVLTAPGVLRVDTVVTDPAVFPTPWTYTKIYKRNPARATTEQNYCVAALDRSVDQNGVEIFDLTPPPEPDKD
jgi:hypothetical protein